MQPFHTINVSEMCGEVVLSQGVILLDQSAPPVRVSRGMIFFLHDDSRLYWQFNGDVLASGLRAGVFIVF